MNYFYSILFAIFLFYNNGNSQEIMSYDAINAMIQEGREKADFKKLGQAYYYRALTNISFPMKRDEVVEDLQQSASYFRYVRDTLGFFTAHTTLADTYIQNNIYLDNAIQMLMPAISYFEKTGLKKDEARSYTLLSKAYEEKQEYDKALEYLGIALERNKEVNDSYLEIQNALSISNLLTIQGDVEKAISIVENTIIQSQELGDANLLAECYFNLGSFYYKVEELEKAVSHLEQANSISNRQNDQKTRIYDFLALCYHDLGLYKKALDHQKNYSLLKDSLMNLENAAINNKLAVDYQTREQEREIQRLETETKFRKIQLGQQKRLLFTLAMGILAGLLALVYIVRFYSQKIKVSELLASQKEKLNNQKIVDLENDIKIKSLESMVTGQEVERKRIATDLHDSLGGMLSALKLQFDSLLFYKNKKEKEVSYDNIHKLIDNACSEVRDIARNLKPSALEKMGLEASIRDLINRFKGAGNAEISFHSSGINGILEYESKLHVYRIVQELLNNAYKHSAASEIDIQMTVVDNEFIIKVEDDGIGYDQKLVKKGLGLDNIQSRVNILKGEISIDSIHNGGTSVIIYFPISQSQKAEKLDQIVIDSAYIH